MQKLTRKEEEIMQVLWGLKKAFVKEIQEELPEPKPHYNTVSTMIKILEEKGFIDRKKFGNMYQYFPVVAKTSYQSDAADDLVAKYFDGSSVNIIAHFAKKENMSEAEIQEIIKMIKSNKS